MRKSEQMARRRYETSTPRFAIGAGAAAMTLITMTALVIVPARLEAVTDSVDAQEVSKLAATLASTGVAMDHAMDLVGTYEAPPLSECMRSNPDRREPLAQD
jgi:hypothetical protein